MKITRLVRYVLNLQVLSGIQTTSVIQLFQILIPSLNGSMELTGLKHLPAAALPVPHSILEMMQPFHFWGAQKIKEVLVFWSGSTLSAQKPNSR